MITDIERKVKEVVPLAIKEAIEKHIRLGEPVVFAEGDKIRSIHNSKKPIPPAALDAD